MRDATRHHLCQAGPVAAEKYGGVQALEDATQLELFEEVRASESMTTTTSLTNLDGGPTTLPDGSAERKAFPLYRGLFRYFPAALAGVSAVSQFGNDKHNPGEEMHHARGKSMDHADCILRHLIDLPERGGRDEHGIPQVAYIAWRALALAQAWYEENEGAPMAPGAKNCE